MLLSGEKRRYCWTRIHPYGVNYLEAFTDNVKHPNWAFFLNGHCYQEYPIQGEFSRLHTGKFQHEVHDETSAARAGTRTLSEFESEIAKLVFTIFLHLSANQDGKARGCYHLISKTTRICCKNILLRRYGSCNLQLPYFLNNMFLQQNLYKSDLSHPVPSIDSSSG